MLSLNLPSHPLKIVSRDNSLTVFDPIRKKYVSLTPEEWVRQNFVQFLINDKGYPPALISNEISIRLNKTAKRCDTVIYNRELKAMVLVEYKAPEVVITQKVFEQISRYNIVYKVPYLIVSNGMMHYCCHVDYDTQKVTFISEIPDYQSII